MTAKSVGGCSASLAEAEDIRDRVCCFLRVEDELGRGVVVMPDSSDLLDEACSAGVVQSAAPALVAKLAIGGFGLALIETLSAKLRIFRAPEFLGTAFLLAVLAMLVNLLLGT